MRPHVLLLDEPAAGLMRADKAELSQAPSPHRRPRHRGDPGRARHDAGHGHLRPRRGARRRRGASPPARPPRCGAIRACSRPISAAANARRGRARRRLARPPRCDPAGREAHRRLWRGARAGRASRFDVRPGEMVAADRRQRRRQVHHHARAVAACCGRSPARSCSTTGASRRCEAHRIAAAGLALVPEGRQVFPELTVLRQPSCSAPIRGPTATMSSRMIDAMLERFPRLRERLSQPGRPALRRRAADAGDRARADGEAAHPAARRALARARARHDQRAVRHPRRPARRRASPSCWSTRWRRWRSPSPTAAMCWNRAASCAPTAPRRLPSDPALEAAYLGRAEAAQ